MTQIISIGKKPASWLDSAINEYQKRLSKPYQITWTILPSSKQSGELARNEESTKATGRLKNNDFVIVLDETGENIDSPTLSHLIENATAHSKNPVFIIGGAYGVNQALLERADFVWSLSNLVFPHQIVRLILTEQIYRAEQIAKNTGYHHV